MVFYAAQILARDGPLGLVWMAAWDRQLKRNQVTETSIPGDRAFHHKLHGACCPGGGGGRSQHLWALQGMLFC